jgi:hypothetical protein
MIKVEAVVLRERVETVIDAVQNGGTHGSPVGPLLYGSHRSDLTQAALGQSPASPTALYPRSKVRSERVENA